MMLVNGLSQGDGQIMAVLWRWLFTGRPNQVCSLHVGAPDMQLFQFLRLEAAGFPVLRLEAAAFPVPEVFKLLFFKLFPELGNGM